MPRRMSRLKRERGKSSLDCGPGRSPLRPGIFERRSVGSLRKLNWKGRRSSATAAARFTTRQTARITRRLRSGIEWCLRRRLKRRRRGIGRRRTVREDDAKRNDQSRHANGWYGMAKKLKDLGLG